MDVAVYAADALETNRSGELTADQRRWFEATVKIKHPGLLGVAARALDPLTADLKKGRVESVAGALQKPTPRTIYGGGPGAPGINFRHWLHVVSREAGEQKFRTPIGIYDFAPDGGMVRLYYLPASHWTVNLELTPDPIPGGVPSPDVLAQFVHGYASSRAADDAVGAAEAAAHAADAIHEQERAAGKVQSAPQSAVDPQSLADAIVGTWTSVWLTITLEKGGRFTARFSDGSTHDGPWSIDADGRLHADIMGSPIVARASLAGDGLGLVFDDGQALQLQRATS